MEASLTSLSHRRAMESKRRHPISRAFFVLMIVSMLVGCGPMDTIPGIRLGGTPSKIPSTGFSFVQNGHEEIQIEAMGILLPRVVTIWGVGVDESLYVWGNSKSSWARRTSQRPDVRIRIGDSVYELRAKTVTDADERRRVAGLYNEKYGEELRAMFGRKPEVEDFKHFVRLSPRSSRG